MAVVRHKHEVKQEYPRQGITDYEVQMAYELQYNGPVHVDQVEVCAVKWVPLTEFLNDCLYKHSDQYTPWCVSDAKEYAILKRGLLRARM